MSNEEITEKEKWLVWGWMFLQVILICIIVALYEIIMKLKFLELFSLESMLYSGGATILAILSIWHLPSIIVNSIQRFSNKKYSGD